jgi:hypothetical protein
MLLFSGHLFHLIFVVGFLMLASVAPAAFCEPIYDAVILWIAMALDLSPQQVVLLSNSRNCLLRKEDTVQSRRLLDSNASCVLSPFTVYY